MASAELPFMTSFLTIDNTMHDLDIIAPISNITADRSLDSSNSINLSIG